MINNSFLLGLFFFASILSATSQGAIFGDGDPANGIEDQRQQAPRYLGNAVGTIFCDGGLRGTATHITIPLDSNSSVILTAAHVLFDAKTGQPFKICRYLPQNQRLNSVGFSAVAQHRFRPLSNDKIRQSETDIVFIALQKRIYQTSFKLALAKNSARGDLQLLGYNAETQSIDISDGCERYNSKIFASKRLLLHNCDALGGASGGPIISAASGDSSHTVVAVHGGTLFREGFNADDDSAVPGAKANPERWINQARKIDIAVLNQLELFLAYLAKDFPSQK